MSAARPTRAKPDACRQCGDTTLAWSTAESVWLCLNDHVATEPSMSEFSTADLARQVTAAQVERLAKTTGPGPVAHTPGPGPMGHPNGRYEGRILDVRAMLAQPDEPIPWRCDNLAADGYLTVLAGKGGEGKSWLALTLACGVARGAMAAGIPCTKGRALIFDAENGPKLTIRRFRAAQVADLAVQPVDAGGLRITTDIGWFRVRRAARRRRRRHRRPTRRARRAARPRREGRHDG